MNKKFLRYFDLPIVMVKDLNIYLSEYGAEGPG
jgi:hypothetical protein